MLIQVKNKDTMVVGNFTFRCCVGKGGIKKNKIEGDKSTPKGTFSIGKLVHILNQKSEINLGLRLL